MQDQPPKGEWLSLDQLIEELAAAEKPVVALSISGGGASGAYQAGVLRGYFEAIERKVATLGERARQATPRLIIGTSAGALNAYGLLLEYLRSPEGDRCGSFQPEPFISALWRTIGSEDDGARFVTGRRAWLVSAATRWLRDRRIRNAVLLALLAAGGFLLNPVLFAIVLLARQSAWSGAVGRCIVANPVTATVGAALLLVAVVAWLALRLRRSLFSNDALLDVLTSAAEAGLAGSVPTRRQLLARQSPFARQRAGMNLVAAWHSRPRPPDFILTATDVTAAWECLFTLARPETVQRLASAGWLVSEIGGPASAAPAGGAGGCASVPASDLLRCVVASTSIPGVFPSQRIRLSPAGGGPVAVHDFVDGGVLNNSPMNVAVDARATHVISIELDPLRAPSPLGTQAEGGEPSLPANVAATFATLLNMATTEDIYRTVAINLRVRSQVLLDDPATPRATLLTSRRHGKGVVEIFRIAPETRDLETLDFNGHYATAFSSPAPSLVAWLEQGAGDVRRQAQETQPRGVHSPFWRATFEAYP
jgi:hypothetical protein